LARQDLANETGKGYTHLSDSFKNSIKLDLKFWDGKLTDQNETETFVDLTYERRPVSWLGFQGTLGVGSGSFKNTSDGSDLQNGTANTTKHTNGGMSLFDANVAAVLYTGFHGTYLKIEAGEVSGSHKTMDVTYNNLGTGTVKTSTEKIQQGYTGAQIGFDTRDSRSHWGLYGEVGVRKAQSIGVVGTIGVNFGF
jgi:hypothetical protein